MKRRNFLLLAIGWVVCLFVVGCGMGSAKPAKPQVGQATVDPSPNTAGTAVVKAGTVGTLKWEIYDTKAGKLIAAGDKDFAVANVKIEPVSDFFSKTIEIGNHFSIGISGSADGFALIGERDDKQTFSWDWFNIYQPGHAEKLQEPGELAFEVVTTPNGQEVSRLEFLTDVSIRVTEFGNMDVLNPEWRIKVLKGSVIVWPYLDKGKTVEP